MKEEDEDEAEDGVEFIVVVGIGLFVLVNDVIRVVSRAICSKGDVSDGKNGTDNVEDDGRVKGVVVVVREGGVGDDFFSTDNDCSV